MLRDYGHNPRDKSMLVVHVPMRGLFVDNKGAKTCAKRIAGNYTCSSSQLFLFAEAFCWAIRDSECWCRAFISACDTRNRIWQACVLYSENFKSLRTVSSLVVHSLSISFQFLHKIFFAISRTRATVQLTSKQKKYLDDHWALMCIDTFSGGPWTSNKNQRRVGH